MKIALFGAAGRMGREIVAALRESSELELVAAVDRVESEDIGRDAGEVAGGSAIGVALSSDLSVAAESADVLIDYSSPTGFGAALKAAQAAGCAFVSGTTGLDENGEAALKAAARVIPALHATNMSFGMALLNRLAGEVAGLLGEDFDVEIVEMHHRHKKDAPSGSALSLGKSVAAARGTAVQEYGEFGRHGKQVRVPGSIGFASLRGGDVAGDHTVVFAGDGERLELTHRAGSRRIFANGALRAAAWLVNQPAGLYGIDDMLD
jgi:4-hydroxy-tetrahydrodipicolinate reductase